MLYEGTIRFLQQAIDAIEQEDAPLRYEKLSRAGEIILALQSAIDLDNGGQQALGLYGFYATIDGRIVALHRSKDAVEGARIIAELRSMRDVWAAIDSGEAHAS